MNINSVRRHYLPFGARGTVVGKTEDKVIVLFDEQFLQGTTVYGHCPSYRGALMVPEYLINLSREFANIAKSNRHALKKFQERPQQGQSEYGVPKAQSSVDSTQITDTAGAGSEQIATGEPTQTTEPPTEKRGERPRRQEESKQSTDAPRTWIEAQAFVPTNKQMGARGKGQPQTVQMKYQAKVTQPPVEEAP